MDDTLLARMKEDMEKIPPTRKVRQRRLWYSAVAAVAALLIFVFWPWNKGPMLVQTGIGEQKTIALPDGSIVTMNAVSELKIETAEWSDVRQITLHGEAFFDVLKNSDVPFYVITTNGKVTVLGTSFSVFDREKTFEVACYRGLVKAESSGILMEIPETRKIASSGNGNWLNSEVNEGDTPPWTKGQSAFSNAPLTVVIAELERQYGIHVESKVAIDQQFTGAFPNKNLNAALEIICEILQLKYKENDSKNILLEDK